MKEPTCGVDLDKAPETNFQKSDRSGESRVWWHGIIAILVVVKEDVEKQ